MARRYIANTSCVSAVNTPYGSATANAEAVVYTCKELRAHHSSYSNKLQNLNATSPLGVVTPTTSTEGSSSVAEDAITELPHTGRNGYSLKDKNEAKTDSTPRNYMDEVCSICCVKAGNSFFNDPNPNSFNDSPNFFNHPLQPQMYSCELCGNDAHYGYDCPPQVPLPPIFYDDDDDDEEESSIPLRDLISELPLSVAITLDLPITDSLIMEDEHLNTIPEMESNEENESSVKDLNLTPSESEDLSDIESECDMPVCDDFMTFSNPLFDSNDDFTSGDDESLSGEDIPKENFKIYSNPLFDEEINSTKIDPHHFNTESDLIESLLNRDTLIVSSPKFDSLLEELSGELAHIDLISPEIDEAEFDPKEEIRLVEKLLYDNSSPRPPEKLNSENSDAVIESFSPSPIPVEDSDSLIEEIDIFLAPDDSIPPSIKNDDYDSEGDILFLEELLSNDSLFLLEMSHFILIVIMINHLRVLLRNHRMMMEFSLILGPIREF
ncbi:hypothetical protein Tco_1153460 [Tanacetum coccineum]